MKTLVIFLLLVVPCISLAGELEDWKVNYWNEHLRALRLEVIVTEQILQKAEQDRAASEKVNSAPTGTVSNKTKKR